MTEHIDPMTRFKTQWGLISGLAWVHKESERMNRERTKNRMMGCPPQPRVEVKADRRGNVYIAEVDQ